MRISRIMLSLLATLSLFGGCADHETDGKINESTLLGKLSQDYVTAFVQRTTLEAKKACLDRELQRLRQMESAGKITVWPDDLVSRFEPEIQLALATLLQEASAPYAGAPAEGHAAVQKELDNRVKDWTTVRDRLSGKQQQLFEARAATQIQGQLATLLSLDNPRLWFFFAISIGGLVGIVLHERRHVLRRVLNGGKPQALGFSKILSVLFILLIILSVTFLVSGDMLYQHILVLGTGEESPQVALQRDLKEVTQDVGELEKQTADLEKQHDEAVVRVHKRLEQEHKTARGLAELTERYPRSIIGSVTALQGVLAVTKELNSDLDVLANMEKELDSERDKTVRFARFKRMIRFGSGFFLLLITGGVGWLHVRGVRAAAKIIAATCPVCLRQTFKDVPLKGADRDLRTCQETLDDGQPCDFLNKDAYRELPKLCFVTLGHPASGKTFWLALCYHQLRLGQGVPESIHCEETSTEGSKKLDEILYYIIEERAEPGATDPGQMPRPVLFNFRDHDPWGKSDELLTIFDFSGEITTDRETYPQQRERALRADGFLYFIDPTMPSHAQIDSLRAFREDIKALMGLKAGDQVRSAVAICLSKIDLLGCQEYADRKGVIGKFYDDLAEIDRTVCMKNIRRRSELVTGILPFIWPDWPIEKQIKKLFGGRIMFFPMTPIGMGVPFENSLESIAERDIDPYLILEPMLWLVHMTGHLVLDEMSPASRILAKITRG